MVSGGWWPRGGEAPIGGCRHPTAPVASVRRQRASSSTRPSSSRSTPSLPEAWEAALACVGGWDVLYGIYIGASELNIPGPSGGCAEEGARAAKRELKC